MRNYFSSVVPSTSLLMAVLGLIFTATKLAGVLVTITLAANALSFSRYRRKNLRSIRPLIDESSETLAVFDVDAEGDSTKIVCFFSVGNRKVHHELPCGVGCFLSA